MKEKSYKPGTWWYSDNEPNCSRMYAKVAGTNPHLYFKCYSCFCDACRLGYACPPVHYKWKPCTKVEEKLLEALYGRE